MKRYLLLLTLIFPLMASAKTTTSVADGNWGNAATWDNGTPSSGDIVIVNHDVVYNTSFSVGAGTLTINSGASLVKAAGQDLNMWNAGGVVNNYGTLTVDVVDCKGTIYNEGTLNLRTFNSLYDAGLVENHGTVNMTGALNVYTNSSIINYGDFSFPSGNIWTNGDIKNYGNFTHTGTNTLSIGVDSIINEGSMSIFTLDTETNALVNNGDFEVRNVVNDFYGGILTNNGNFEVAGRFDQTGPTELINNGEMIIGGNYNVWGDAGYDNVNNGWFHVLGRVDNVMPLENNGAYYVYGGNFDNSDEVSTGSCGHFNVNCGTFRNWDVISGDLNIVGNLNLGGGVGAPATTVSYNRCAHPGKIYSRATANWDSYACGSSTWSRIEVDGIECLEVPGPGDTAIIDKHTVTLNGTAGPIYDISWLRVTDENGTSQLSTSGTAGLTITEGIEILNTNAARTATLTMDNSAAFDVGGGLHIEATGNSRATLTMNTSSAITLEGDISRGANLYGVIDGNDNSSITLDGSSDQAITGPDGSVTDQAEFNILTINNTDATTPMITVDNNIRVGQELDLTDGVVFVDAGDKITILDDATTSNASGASYVIGWVNKVGNDGFTFPVGDASTTAFTTITAPDDATDEFRAKYVGNNPHTDGYDTSQVAGLNHVSGEEYWLIEPVSGTASIKISLPVTSNNAYVDTIADVRVAHWTGATWEDEGKTATSGDKNNGTVSSDFVSSFSPFSTGQTDSPLPVELVRFDGEMTDEGALLEWMTASERDNAWFVVEKMDAKGEFVEIARLAGAGNSNRLNSYQYLDDDTYPGYNYYRLRQIDYNGTETAFGIISVKHETGTEVESYYADGQLKLSLSTPTAGKAQMILYDAQGRTMLQESLQGGENSYYVGNLAKGPYLMRIVIGTDIHTRKVIVY